MAVFKTFAKTIMAPGKRCMVVCGGVPGRLNKNHTVLITAPNLKGWVGKPIKKTLEKIFRAPVFLENDAVLAGLGEATRGAGRKHRIVVCLTVGTGVGGARISHGKIDEKASRLEPGHHIVTPHGLRCSCGKRGHLEAYVSGGAFEQRYHKYPKHISDGRIWKEAARILAIGVYNAIRYWSPGVVVLGGSMILGKPAIPLATVRQELKALFTSSSIAPPIKKAVLGDRSGLYGALACAKRNNE